MSRETCVLIAETGENEYRIATSVNGLEPVYSRFNPDTGKWDRDIPTLQEMFKTADIYYHLDDAIEAAQKQLESVKLLCPVVATIDLKDLDLS